LSGLTRQQMQYRDTGSTRGDLQDIVEGYISLCLNTQVGRLAATLVAEVNRNPDFAVAHQAFFDSWSIVVEQVLRRGIDRGDLRADADLSVVADFLIAPVSHRFLVSKRALDDKFVAAVVDATMRAFAAPSDPGAP
jgi:hypothetical protein